MLTSSVRKPNPTGHSSGHLRLTLGDIGQEAFKVRHTPCLLQRLCQLTSRVGFVGATEVCQNEFRSDQRVVPTGDRVAVAHS